MPKTFLPRLWARMDRLFNKRPKIKPSSAAAILNLYLGTIGSHNTTIHPRTIERAQDRFFWFGTTQPTRGHRKGKKRMNWRDVEALRAIVEKDPSLFLDEMAKLLLKRTRKKFGTRAISRWLRRPVSKGGLGMSRKVLERRCIRQDAEERMRYRNAVRYCRASSLVFIDESHKDDRSQRRRRGWSLRGTPAVVYSPISRGTKYSMLGACDINGMMLDACDAVEGMVDSEVLNHWAEHRLCPTYGRQRLPPFLPSLSSLPFPSRPSCGRQPLHVSCARVFL